jgi:hypothetical protein
MQEKLKQVENPKLREVLLKHAAVFGELPATGSVKKLVTCDLELKDEFKDAGMRRGPYRLPQADSDEVDRQVLEGVVGGVIEEFLEGRYPKFCSPCFLVDKPGSTAKRLVVDYSRLNTMTKNHSGTLPYMETTVERSAKCRYKTKMDLRSGFWQVELSERAKDLLAFVTPRGRVFRWKVMPFRVANAPAVFQELISKILSMTRTRKVVQELISRGAELEAHIDDVLLGADSEEDMYLLISEFLSVLEECNLKLKWEKCEWCKEQVDYLGFEIGWGWWRPSSNKVQPLQSATITDDRTKGVQCIRSFVGAVNLYRRHVKSFTYSSAPLTHLTKKDTP